MALISRWLDLFTIKEFRPNNLFSRQCRPVKCAAAQRRTLFVRHFVCGYTSEQRRTMRRRLPEIRKGWHWGKGLEKITK
jgi:hypothetical protein